MIHIFTEAGGSSGFGHLSRCISLYDECVERSLDVRLVVNAFSKLPETINERSVTLTNWLDSSFLQSEIHFEDFAIVDSYLAPYEIYDLISGICKNVVFIDDFMRISYPKGIVVCPSLYGHKLSYPKIDGVYYYGGNDYIILRPEFRLPVRRLPQGKHPHFLITMGGTDFFRLTAPVLSAICREFPSSLKSVVLGSITDDKKAVEDAADSNTDISVSLDAKQMRDIMIQADIAITATGQTIHELLCSGISMIPIMVADNQRLNIQALNNLGFTHIDALDEVLDPTIVDWKSLVLNAPRLPPFKFEGHKNIVELLLCRN